MANYGVTRSELLSGMGLDADVADALVRRLHVRDHPEPRNSPILVTDPLESTDELPGVAQGTDVLVFDFSGGIRDAGLLPPPPPAIEVDLGDLSRSTIKGLDVVTQNDDTSVDIDLAGFAGTVILGNGDNRVTGHRPVAVQTGSGDDTITTGERDDTVVSGEGDDVVTTSLGHDLVKAGAGDDRVDAGRGDDTVHSGFGDDSIELGVGQDRAVIQAQAGNQIRVDGGKGVDLLDLSEVRVVSAELSGGPGSPVMIVLDNGATVEALDFERFLYESDGEGVKLVGLDGFLSDFAGFPP